MIGDQREKNLVTKGMTLVTEGKALVTEGKTLVTGEKTNHAWFVFSSHGFALFCFASPTAPHRG